MSADPIKLESEVHYLLVRSGGHRCAIPVSAARLVTGAPRVSPLPGSAPRLLGLAQIAGEPIAVVDLHALLDPDGAPGGGHELTVVVRPPGGSSSLGLAVDEAFGVTAVRNPKGPSADDPAWVSGRSSMDDRTVFVLDPEQLFVPAQTG
jgi:chemotaxis signal transduction protein